MDIFAVLLPILVIGFMLFVFTLLGRAIVQSIRENRANRAAPVEIREARLVAKRTNVSGGAGDSSASTTYYATFEYQSGDREEFRIPGKQYGMLAEGDQGLLTRQGTWFRDFERTRSARR